MLVSFGWRSCIPKLSCILTEMTAQLRYQLDKKQECRSGRRHVAWLFDDRKVCQHCGDMCLLIAEELFFRFDVIDRKINCSMILWNLSFLVVGKPHYSYNPSLYTYRSHRRFVSSDPGEQKLWLRVPAHFSAEPPPGLMGISSMQILNKSKTEKSSLCISVIFD